MIRDAGNSGSRATHVLSAMGGHRGRPLAAGDRLPLQDDFFDDASLDALQRTRFTVSSQSNRMAYRLTGGRVRRAAEREMISDTTLFGGVQVPPSGEPVLLMADRQTSGGYPQVATVITADLPLAGQLAPGDWVEFSVCTRREAMAALFAREGQRLAVF